jgi:transposase
VGGATPAQHIVFQGYVRAVQEPTERLPRRAYALHAQGKPWRLQPVGEAMQAWRGVPGTVAVTIGAARGDLPRCDIPRQRMKDLGRPPSDDASGARRRPGAITKTGTPQARRALVAGAWACRYPAQVSRHRQ